jgi:uncharacterized membrane protein
MKNNTFRLFALLLVLINAGYVFWKLPNLPDVIPTHFGMNGEIDSWGSKYTIFIPLLIQFGVSLLLDYTSRHPEKHNYPFQITDENKGAQYAASARLMQRLTILVGIIFTTISYAIVNAELPTYVVIFELVGLMALIIVHLIHSSKIK